VQYPNNASPRLMDVSASAAMQINPFTGRAYAPMPKSHSPAPVGSNMAAAMHMSHSPAPIPSTMAASLPATSWADVPPRFTIPAVNPFAGSAQSFVQTSSTPATMPSPNAYSDPQHLCTDNIPSNANTFNNQLQPLPAGPAQPPTNAMTISSPLAFMDNAPMPMTGIEIVGVGAVPKSTPVDLSLFRFLHPLPATVPMPQFPMPAHNSVDDAEQPRSALLAIEPDAAPVSLLATVPIPHFAVPAYISMDAEQPRSALLAIEPVAAPAALPATVPIPHFSVPAYNSVDAEQPRSALLAIESDAASVALPATVPSPHFPVPAHSSVDVEQPRSALLAIEPESAHSTLLSSTINATLPDTSDDASVNQNTMVIGAKPRARVHSGSRIGTRKHSLKRPSASPTPMRKELGSPRKKSCITDGTAILTTVALMHEPDYTLSRLELPMRPHTRSRVSSGLQKQPSVNNLDANVDSFEF
jgi:hypothetical protein